MSTHSQHSVHDQYWSDPRGIKNKHDIDLERSFGPHQVLFTAGEIPTQNGKLKVAEIIALAVGNQKDKLTYKQGICMQIASQFEVN